MIDTHHHFWRTALQEQPWRSPTHTQLAVDFEPADLAPLLEASGVEATVLVESVDTPEENDRLAAYAAAFPQVAGVVGWLPLADPAIARAELARADRSQWCGVRCLVARDSLDWLDPGLMTTLAAADLVWDVVPVTDAQVAAVAGLARRVPELRIVVDHLARPPLETGDLDAWVNRLATLAACPNVALKLSIGIDLLTTWPRWDPAAIAPAVAHAVAAFGPERLMFASNWPVVTIRADYATALRDLEAAVVAAGVDDAGLAEVRAGTATRWYRLPRRR
ncbi:amidohydrolase family protein [Pseudonocardia sp. DSM 110487]|uniref:amidohydrolase family protein n=1 Tax=Pseudonocardia sp. DSM 110487 TaxID=2865833 RepID=UPI001C6A4CA3|nr:amidohydrolase family protein [Pseudonocardia sp. DSM 110487]QYN38351.1 amidohydrolase family protein [Pseudonocardia sp. DSM 110487]